jgi:cyanate permease
MKFLKDLTASLNHNGSGFSIKKLLAVLTFLLIAYIVVKFTNKDNLVLVLAALCPTFGALLGISTYHELQTQNQTPDTSSVVNQIENTIGK